MNSGLEHPAKKHAVSDKMLERYLKYRHYYAGIDISGFGEYGRAVYAPVLPKFDVWYERKYLDDITENVGFLEEKIYHPEHPEFTKERNAVIDCHIKVMALSITGLNMHHNRNYISEQMLGGIIHDISSHTKSYDFSGRLCFSITVNMFIDMLKDVFPSYNQIKDLSFNDFANEETLNPKPQPVVIIPW
jgi:hypothetical protein